jgi:hypothetical protein
MQPWLRETISWGPKTTPGTLRATHSLLENHSKEPQPWTIERLAQLPQSKRSDILSSIFRTIIVPISRGAIRQSEQKFGLETPGLRPEFWQSTSTKREISPLPSLPSVLSTLLETFGHEIGDSWHGQVTYSFPSTVAFLDVLLQWPPQKVQTMPYAHVVGTSLPLYRYPDQEIYIVGRESRKPWRVSPDSSSMC